MGYCKPFKRGVSWRSQNFGANATIYGPHSGNDDAAPIGTPVHAAGDGYIDWAGEFDDTYLDNLLWLLKMGGNILVLNCGADKPSFVYGHLHSFTVKRGDWVRKGQVIAYSGNTGTATTGAHLHTEAIPPGYALNSPLLGRVNPDIYLTEWPEDINVGSLSYASETITPLEEEGFLMALTDKQQEDIYWMLCAPDGRQYLADLVGGRAAEKTLNAPIGRQGSGLGGETSLAAFVAWNDAHVEAIVRAVSAVAPTADLDAVKAAVREGLAEGVNVTATVSVEGPKSNG